MNIPRAYFHVTRAGFLRISGEDRIDFLQRQTTNDVASLRPDAYLSTVLTNPSARIVDVLQVFVDSDDTLGAVTLPNRGELTALFLKRRIFFMDKVRVTDASSEMTVIDLEGRDLQKAAGQLGIHLPETGELKHLEIGGLEIRAAGQRGPGTRSVRLIVPTGERQAIIAALQNSGVEPITADGYETLRVSAGMPGANGELTEEFTPLEARLDHLISETKGCYTGQEVIARQITYDKITRSLVGVRLESPVEPGARVSVEGQNAGTITSYAQGPGMEHLALAVLKRPHFEPGTQVTVEHEGETVPGTVSDLPFTMD